MVPRCHRRWYHTDIRARSGQAHPSSTALGRELDAAWHLHFVTAMKIRTLQGQVYSLGKAVTPIPCFRCGLCCRGFLVKLSSADIRLLSRGLGISGREFRSRYVKKTLVGPLLRQTGDRCVFLDHGERAATGCSVYACRPEVCRNWVPTLSRPECLEGLRRITKEDELLLPANIYSSAEDSSGLCSIIAAGPSERRLVLESKITLT